jgi:cobalt-zinc-cadmium efflux system outer membrane protein
MIIFKMKKYLFLLINLLIFSTISAQERQMLKLSPEQIEALFLRKNLQLIAEKMNIDISDAAVSQAKLWDNPELSINQVNFWKEGARNTEFSVELSQLFRTANKRGKLVSKEKTAKEMAVQEFEDVLRGLKLELRKSVSEIVYLQSFQKVLENQSESLSQLILVYKRQFEQNNIAKTELLRLQSSALELENERNEVKTEWNAQQKFLKSILNLDYSTTIEVESGNEQKTLESISLSDLIQTALESRPDMKFGKLQTQYYEKSLIYEKSLRVPDITLNGNYDRLGGVWKDFVGVGISFELPFFNRNQGNIKAAKIGKEQSQYLFQQQQNTVQHEVSEAFDNYMLAYQFYKKTSENELFAELDDMLDIYAKNLINKNISMLEYIDFMESYKTNKQTMLAACKKLTIVSEELNFVVGK